MELKPKAAGEYLHDWDEKYGSGLEVTGTQGKGENEGRARGGNLFPVSCSWASQRVHPAGIKKKDEPSGRKHKAGYLSNPEQILLEEDHVTKRVFNAVIIL